MYATTKEKIRRAHEEALETGLAHLNAVRQAGGEEAETASRKAGLASDCTKACFTSREKRGNPKDILSYIIKQTDDRSIA